MTDSNDRVVAALFLGALLSLALFLLNWWALFGVAACGMLVLGLWLGFGGDAQPRIRRVLLLMFTAYVVLLGGIVWADRTSSGLTLVFGFPVPTALLVYGIWPMPLLAGLLYALVFRRSVLPEEKLRKFLAEHGRR